MTAIRRALISQVNILYLNDGDYIVTLLWRYRQVPTGKTHFNKTFKRNMAEPSCKMKTCDEEKLVFDAFEKNMMLNAKWQGVKSRKNTTVTLQ